MTEIKNQIVQQLLYFFHQRLRIPLNNSKTPYQFIVCPVFHPKFFLQDGRNAYKSVDDDIDNKSISAQTPSKEFKKYLLKMILKLQIVRCILF